MNKIIYSLSFLALVILIFSSCSDLLNEENVSGVTKSLYTTESGFENGVNAAYNTARIFYGRELGGTLTVFGTDTWTNGAGGKQKYYNQYTPQLNPQDGYINIFWSSFYQGINTINTVLSDTSTVNMNSDTKEQRIAELKFLRALYYFDLVRMYGPIPLHLKPTEGVTTEEERNSVSSVYNQIIKDLDYGVNTLPRQAEEYGRVTEGAAQHLLAMVYLTRGYKDDDQSDFDKAATLAKSVINSDQYSLLDNFADIFDINNQQNNGVIFSVQYTQNTLSNGAGNHAHLFFGCKYDEFPGMERSLSYWRPWTRFEPTEFLLNLWNNHIDTRYHDSFITAWHANNASSIPMDDSGNPKYAVGDTAVYMPDPDDQKDYSDKPYKIIKPSEYYSGNDRYYPSLSKFLDHQRPSINYENGSKDFIVYRLGETYLIAAEALFKEGKKDEATTYINKLRERAAMSGKKEQMDIASSQLTLDFIANEWARETAGEYRRWFDIKRMGLLVSRVKEYNKQDGDNIDSHFLLRPIPQSEIDAVTSKDFNQNSGY